MDRRDVDPSCDCGAGDPTSARHNHMHLKWCAIYRRVPAADTEAEAGVVLTERLRAVLIEHFPQEPSGRLAAALAYELASVLASMADTPMEAILALRATVVIQVDQIRRFGVGRAHP